MNICRKDFSAIYVKGFIYIFGGINENNEILSSCEKYDIFSNKWVLISEMCYPRKDHICLYDEENGYLYTFGGQSFFNDYNNINIIQGNRNIER